MVDVLERGDIFFFYLPKVEEEKAEGLEDVQRFHMVLNPDNGGYRDIIIGRKRLPMIKPGVALPQERIWGFVDGVYRTPEEQKKALGGTIYRTRTRGVREREGARAIAEGRYVIGMHHDHTHLAYAIEFPHADEFGEVQQEFRIKPRASYVLSIKNPEVPPEHVQKPNFPASLEEKFGDRRFAKIAEPRMLDYPGVELVLIGARAGEGPVISKLHPPKETEEESPLFTELHFKEGGKRVRPLTKGVWE